MIVSNDVQEDLVTFKLEGELDTGTSADVQKEIFAVLDKIEINKVIVNLEKTEYVSSSGLRVFLTLAKRLKSIGGALKLCQANNVVDEVLSISGFKKIIDVVENEEAAIVELKS